MPTLLWLDDQSTFSLILLTYWWIVTKKRDLKKRLVVGTSISESTTLKSKSKSRSKWTQVGTPWYQRIRKAEYVESRITRPTQTNVGLALTDCLLESFLKSMHSFSVAAINRGRLHSHTGHQLPIITGRSPLIPGKALACLVVHWQYYSVSRKRDQNVFHNIYKTRAILMKFGTPFRE